MTDAETVSSACELPNVKTALCSSSTKVRLQHLGVLLTELSARSIPDSSVSQLLNIFFNNHAFYHDRASRRAVNQCIRAIFAISITERSYPDAVLSSFITSIQKETTKPSIATSNAFVLLEWCGIVLQGIAGTEKWSKWGLHIIVSHATLLEMCLESNERSSVRHSAISSTRRALRKVVTTQSTHGNNIDEIIQTLTTKGTKSTSRNAVFLGVLAGVCARKPNAQALLAANTSAIYNFYVREIIGSKTVVPAHIANGLHDFFEAFCDIGMLQSEVIPGLEKGLLRAPEILLNDLVTPLFTSLPQRIDASKILSDNLLKPLLSNVKSSNAIIRQGALRAYTAIIPHCMHSESLDKIVDELLGPLKGGKLVSADHRVLYAEMLSVTPMSHNRATTILQGVVQIASKEANELALAAEVMLISKMVIWNLQSGNVVPASVANAFQKGLEEKKIPLRRLWALQFGDILLSPNYSNDDRSRVLAFAEPVWSSFKESWNESTTNPLAAATSGLAVVACVFATTVSKYYEWSEGGLSVFLTKKMLASQAIAVHPKPSFLLNHKVYGKFTQENEILWFVKALASFTDDIVEIGEDSALAMAWSQAFISAIVSTPLTRSQAMKTLSSLYVQHQKVIGGVVVRGLWQWILSLESGDKDCAASVSKSTNDSLSIVVRAICLNKDEMVSFAGKYDAANVENLLVGLFVLARAELIPGTNWISLCIRCQVDPGVLAARKSSALLGEIRMHTGTSHITTFRHSTAVERAAFSAAADLAFVAPDVMIPEVVTIFTEDLDPSQMDNIGPTEAAIFRTPEGTAFIDVLAKKTQNVVPNKNTKDYDILKWEEELRASLAQAKGTQKKLNVEESAKVKAQLVKEAGIRSQVRQLEARLYRGIGIIQSLAVGPPTEAELWMGAATKALIDVILSGAGLIIGNAAADAYLACADRVNSRIGSMRPFIGVATLRAMEITHLPDRLTQEPLGELITRVLYRLRFASEQRPFDTVSLAYILPLVFQVLEHGGFGAQDDADAQLVLALELLSFHTEACMDRLVPRAQILSCLIASMQNYNQHYKLIKDCLADVCRSIAPTIEGAEIAVLLQGVIVPQIAVRSSVLQSLNAEIDLSEAGFRVEIWLACHDDIPEHVELAEEIYMESKHHILAEEVFLSIPYSSSSDKQLRRAAARSLAAAVAQNPATLTAALTRLQEWYLELAKPKVPQLDEYGMPRKTDLSDPWEARNGIALSFKELSVVLEESLLDSFLQFLIERGPLGDRNSSVRDEMVDAAVAVVALHGKNKVEELMKLFEATLEAPDQGSEFFDRVNEAVIILYGALARHLAVGDLRVPKVVNRLLATLSTPSETVQYAIADCLPPLIRASTLKTTEYIQTVMDQLLNGKKYPARRGAAYGLAGIVHGAGIAAFREYRIMVTLRSAVDNKKDVNHREGALLAYELLPTVLGRVFEPYVIQIVPQLLSSFGDANADIREGCLAAAKASFASLSSYGVKKILPTLLSGLDDDQWRSKKGACDLLGAMAYLDPAQLAQSLPEIIPPLTAVLNDSHKEVRLAANRSLKRFGEVISNPEIKSLVDILLKALSDPTKYTDDALEALIKVQFVHYLDAPSLALVVRILERGLADRSATKRKSAQVIGSLAHLTDRKDLTSHLPILIAGLRVAVVDPVPTTRATGSKALGSLIEKLGEDALPDLIPSLMQTLKSDTGAGDRLGSAQALSEVLAGLGTVRLEEILPTILQNVTSSKAAVREGFMSLFIFLPVCFGNSFANYLSRIIPPILAGLADELETIRETALRAGRLLVKNFATKAIDLLLPELERGLADDNYRIRLSSVELVGDLLFNLTGITATTEADDVEDGAQEAGASLLEVLGEEKRNKVLSSLYICRCDTSGMVRTAAVNVWKALVASPKTLKELVPTLTILIIERLGSSNMEQKTIAGNALGELIRKAGDGVLSTLLPTLEHGLQTSADIDARQGICIALRELIASASEEALEDHEKTLISVVRTALIDPDEEVREAAAEAFDSLQQIFGKRAVDQVLPHLLALLRTEGEADNALAALLTLLTETTRSNIILPNLIPTLTASPISSFNAKALASLSSVAGSAMTRRLSSIMNALMDNIITADDELRKHDLDRSFDAVILSIDEYDGLNTCMSVMLALAKHDNHRKRSAMDYHFAEFFKQTTVDYSRYNQDIIRALLISFEDREPEVVLAAWTALTEFTKRLKKEEMESLVYSTRQILQQVGVAGSDLPGFSLPKGINAILPIFLQGLMNGSTEQRVQAALAISDIVDRTSVDALKPFVTQITGPLIRVVSERSTDVKAAILLTLNKLLEKIPTFLKPFLPQLQRTFAKSLADSTSEVLRSRAAKALGTLIMMTPRVDPLVAELVTGSKTSDAGVRNAMLKALYEVVSKAGANMSEASRSAVLGLIDSEPEDNDVTMAITNAKLLSALIKNIPDDSAAALIKNRVLPLNISNASILALNAVLAESPKSITANSFGTDLPALLCRGIMNKVNFIQDNSILAAGKYLLSSSSATFEATKPLFDVLASTIAPGNSVDARRLALVVVRTIARQNLDLIKPHVPTLTLPVFASVRDQVIPVKLAAEAAFMAIFSVVDEESRVFDKYIAAQGENLGAQQKRSMQDYFKRVALRLGGLARERKEAEGGAGGLGLNGDEGDDEREIWSIGKVDLGDGVFKADD